MTEMGAVKIETWFDGWSRMTSALLLLALAALLTFSATLQSVRTGSASKPSASRMTDAELYKSVIAGVAKGDGYYQTAVRLHRKGIYPLKPFFVVRLPTLALLSAGTTVKGAHMSLLVLIVGTALSWYRLFRQRLDDRRLRLVAAGFMIVSLAILASPVLALFHDTWAAVLMALSLALNQQKRVWLSIVLGLFATLFRELAAPFLLLMGCVAVWERKWSEAAGWLFAMLLLGLALSIHASRLSPFVDPQDLTSQGWKGMGGWPFYLSTMSLATPLGSLPSWLARILIPLCLFGWIGWKSPLAMRVTGLLLGYGLMLMLFSRPETFYWGLMMTPLLLPGLAIAPIVIARLVGQIRVPAVAAA